LWAFISAKSGRAARRDIEDVWTAIALHTTPGIPEHTRPTIALVAAGVEVDVLDARSYARGSGAKRARMPH
jgi:hypothetical protein